MSRIVDYFYLLLLRHRGTAIVLFVIALGLALRLGGGNQAPRHVHAGSPSHVASPSSVSHH